MMKRILALILSLLMCVSLMPAAFAADEAADTAENTEAAVPCETENTVDTVINIAPDTAVVTVYDADGEVIEAEDGCYKLLPGEYSYSAECEGYAPLVNIPFTVEEGTEPVEISVVMRPEVKISTPVEELLEETESEGENMLDIRVEYESPESSYADYIITRFEDLRTILTTSPYNQLYIRDDSENGIVISEDITIPAGKTITLTGRYVISEGVTVTNNAYISIDGDMSVITVKGALVNNNSIYIFEVSDCRLVVEGSVSGRGIISTYSVRADDSFNITSVAPGLNPDEWAVDYEHRSEYDYYVVWYYAKGLKKLSAPTDLMWHRSIERVWNEDTMSMDLVETEVPGVISFLSDKDGGSFRVNLYRIGPNGNESVTVATGVMGGIERDGKLLNTFDIFAHECRESGTYFFTVQNMGDRETTRDSDEVVSDTWEYVRPSEQLPTPVTSGIKKENGNIFLYFDFPEGRDEVGKVNVEIEFIHDKNSMPNRWVRSYMPAEMGYALLSADMLRNYEGYSFSYRVRSCPKDCTKYMPSEFSEFSEQFDTGTVSQPGDINGDDAVNLKDAVMILKFVTGERVNVSSNAMDVNRDGIINLKDAVLLLKYVSGEDVGIY